MNKIIDNNLEKLNIIFNNLMTDDDIQMSLRPNGFETWFCYSDMDYKTYENGYLTFDHSFEVNEINDPNNIYIVEISGSAQQDSIDYWRETELIKIKEFNIYKKIV